MRTIFWNNKEKGLIAIVDAEARKLDKVEVKSEQAQKPNSYVFIPF
ncbi:MAG: hypothetical protein JSV62_03425 [Promethearchaeota archaeon]|nr:MAG: hypothetical protein JSV62_03425 [Candidatus Lokiarchaeota archaeon]